VLGLVVLEKGQPFPDPGQGPGLFQGTDPQLETEGTLKAMITED